MKIKNFICSKDIEKYDKIYHYTSPEGLYSILKNRSLRFTDCQFFNDKSEYIHIREPLSKAIKKIFPTLVNANLIENIDNWLNEDYEVSIKSDSYSKQRYYVFCTSLEGDALNMWNYYVKGGKYQGYNIGLSIVNLIEYMKKIKLDDAEIWYGPIIYSSYEQEKAIINLIHRVDNMLGKVRKEASYTDYWYSFLQEAQEEIIESIELYRLFFKDNSFKDEREYRFVLKLPIDMMDNSYVTSGYQLRDGILSPFFDLTFIDEILDCITISPMLEENLAKKGIELFMNSKHYKTLKIKHSNIPVRY